MKEFKIKQDLYVSKHSQAKELLAKSPYTVSVVFGYGKFPHDVTYLDEPLLIIPDEYGVCSYPSYGENDVYAVHKLL
ncbi:MAG: hypothetical protein LBC73_09065 [Oscillospiraceae bacterium]|nr:hypothetical protein [Oscillospiraceae bacterium]